MILGEDGALHFLYGHLKNKGTFSAWENFYLRAGVLSLLQKVLSRMSNVGSRAQKTGMTCMIWISVPPFLAFPCMHPTGDDQDCPEIRVTHPTRTTSWRHFLRCASTHRGYYSRWLAVMVPQTHNFMRSGSIHPDSFVPINAKHLVQDVRTNASTTHEVIFVWPSGNITPGANWRLQQPPPTNK